MKCKEHPDVELKCLAGEPAHSSNWYCPQCESMTIDWDKPLECEKYGLVKYTGETCGEYRKVSTVSNYKIDEIAWWVHYETGESTIGMSDVYNAKRKPKAGEWWLTQRSNGVRNVLYYTGNWHVTDNVSGHTQCHGEFELLHPLIKDPSFEE